MIFPLCKVCDCYPCACGKREYEERPELVEAAFRGQRQRIAELEKQIQDLTNNDKNKDLGT